MKMYMIAFALCALAVIAGCDNHATRPDANYQAYLDGQAKQTTLESSKIDSLALAATACAGDARCVENVVAFSALAATGSRGGAQIQPYVERPSFAAQVGLALVGQLAPLAGAAVNWHQADAQRDVTIAQFSYLDHVLTGAVNNMGSVASNAKPNITVGGNYGDTHTGDNVGGSQVGHDYVSGTQTNNSGNLGNDNRQTSPGPIGPTCTGDTCQGTVNPPPTPPPTP